MRISAPRLFALALVLSALLFPWIRSTLQDMPVLQDESPYLYSVIQSAGGRVSVPDSYTTPGECLARASVLRSEDVAQKSLYWCEVSKVAPMQK